MAEPKCPYCQALGLKQIQTRSITVTATALFCGNCGSIMGIVPTQIQAMSVPLPSEPVATPLPNDTLNISQVDRADLLKPENWLSLIIGFFFFAAFGAIIPALMPTDPNMPTAMLLFMSFVMAVIFAAMGMIYLVFMASFMGLLVGTISGSVSKGLVVASRMGVIGAIIGACSCGSLIRLMPPPEPKIMGQMTFTGGILGLIIGVAFGVIFGTMAWAMFRKS